MLASFCAKRAAFTTVSCLSRAARPSLLHRSPQSTRSIVFSMAGATKRKRVSVDVPVKVASTQMLPSAIKRRSSSRMSTAAVSMNPDVNGDIVDAPNATRASPDNAPSADIVPAPIKLENGTRSESPLSDAPEVEPPPELPFVDTASKKRKGKSGVAESKSAVTINGETAKGGKGGKKVKQEDDADAASAITPNPASSKKPKKTEEDNYDPDAEDNEEANEEEVKEAIQRPPPVNSDYLPLPWKGRLGYACLNTYLRASNPPVFSSRTCRIQSILEHRHPLQDPSQPEHATKNRPDRSQPADVERGMRYLESICLANVKDIAKMIRWNDRYNIKFMRLSSEIFPFASHPEYGYKLAPFAADALAEAGEVIAQYGHRVTTHPGQFTQLGSPRKSVTENAVRDLVYHDEMLSLLKLPEQQDKDAVMILHMGGFFDGKEPTLARFREQYALLPQSVKNRLVLENDDVIWSVHDLLPVCEELNIPFVLDYHHHNIIFDATQIREGTKDIMDLYPRILATWRRKGITPKMHYSEPTPSAITGRQRRKHNPRVATLPPCPPDMDLMIEAKDKEQAVFELMRTFKLPGFDTFTDVIPYVREDDNKLALQQMNRKKKSTDEPELVLVEESEVGMGGPLGRVYWPPGMEEYLRPKKREVKKKAEPAEGKDKAQIKKEAEALYAARQAEIAAEEEDVESDEDATPATKKAKAAMRKKERANKAKAVAKAEEKAAKDAAKVQEQAAKQAVKEEEKAGSRVALPDKKPRGRKRKAEVAVVLTPSPSDSPDEPDEAMVMYRDDIPAAKPARKTARASKAKKISYAEDEDDDALLE